MDKQWVLLIPKTVTEQIVVCDTRPKQSVAAVHRSRPSRRGGEDEDGEAAEWAGGG